MNILPVTGKDPIGAAALLDHADPLELGRFVALEDATWGATTLSPSVVEAVRLHCAKIRGCEFCAAVRYTAAIADGLTEAQIEHLGSEEAREDFDAGQSAALTLVDRYLRDPRKPGEKRAREIASTLGTSGVMEVLVACGAFASADLRIALGENREPAGSGVVDRAGNALAAPSHDTSWPALRGSVLDPALDLPGVAAGLAGPIRERVAGLWSGRDLADELVAACILRSAQLFGVAPDDPVSTFLVPAAALSLADPDEVRRWPEWPAAEARYVLALAEPLWMDPAGVDAGIVEPLEAGFGSDGLIRVAWSLILIGQLQRLALVLHRET